MDARIRLALFALFGSLLFVNSAAAQSSQMSSPPLQQTPQKPPSSIKLLPPPPAAQIQLLANQAGSASDRTLTTQELKDWIGALQNQKNGLSFNLQRFGTGPDAPNCAHIRIFQAPEMDSEMIVQRSPGDGGPIQTFQGLPPCRRDLPAPMTVQRFHGLPPILPFQPRRPFIQPPASQIPSAQPQQVRPKTDGSDQKP